MTRNDHKAVAAVFMIIFACLTYFAVTGHISIPAKRGTAHIELYGWPIWLLVASVLPLYAGVLLLHGLQRKYWGVGIVLILGALSLFSYAASFGIRFAS